MKRLSNRMLSRLLDMCNDVELETQETIQYKDLMKQLELTKKKIESETDRQKKEQLWDRIDEIYVEIYNTQLIKCLVKVISEEVKNYFWINELLTE